LLIPCVFVIFLIIVFALQHRGFNSPMVFDSKAHIANNIHWFLSHDPRHLITLFPGRVLFMLTLYLNFLLGGMEPFLFRFTNAVALAATGSALVVLITLILDRPDCEIRANPIQKLFIAIMCGLLFVCHPLQVFAVLYIWQGQAVMACFFYFTALCLYIHARSSGFRDRIPALALTGLLFLLGLMTKESVGSLPAVLILAEWLLLWQNGKVFAQRFLTIMLITVSVLLAYYVITGLFTELDTLASHRGFVGRVELFYQLSGRGFLEVLLTQCSVLFSYLYRILTPTLVDSTLHNVHTVPDSILSPPSSAAAVLGIAAMVTVALLLRRKAPIASFGIFFFVVTLIPESVLVPSFMFCSYRAILPMAGILIILSWGVLTLLPWITNRAQQLITAFILLSAVFYLGSVTVSKANRWNPSDFWKDEYSRLPAYSTRIDERSYLMILLGYAEQLASTGDYANSLALLYKARDDFPRCSKVYNSLGSFMTNRGDLEAAAINYLAAIELDPSDAGNHYGLGIARFMQGDLQEAQKHLARAIELNPGDAFANCALGEVYWKKGNSQMAARFFAAAIERRPDLLAPYLNLGTVLMGVGRVHEARDNFQKAVAIDPGSAKAHANLGIALLALNDFPGAVYHLGKSVELEPKLALAHAKLGTAYEILEELDRAEREYAKAVAIEPSLVDGHLGYANLLARRGDEPAALEHYKQVLKLAPGNCQVQARLGSLYLSACQLAEAIQNLRSALLNCPDLPEAKKKLEEALRRAGAINQ